VVGAEEEAEGAEVEVVGEAAVAHRLAVATASPGLEVVVPHRVAVATASPGLEVVVPAKRRAALCSVAVGSLLALLGFHG
jgi:hypothetical protein